MVLHNLVNVQKKIRLDVYESALDGFFFNFFFVLVGNHMHFDVPSECSQRKDALRGKLQTQSGDYSCQRGRGVRERERGRDRARAGPPGLQMKE